MTAQASDEFIYKRKKYILIDVEKGKQIIDCAKFKMSKHKVAIWSDCWRGYTAKYKVSKDKLYCIRYEENTNGRKVKSPSIFMNFTGSCVIARSVDGKKWHNSDFLRCYLDFDEALELHFTNGVLVEVINLNKAIDEANSFMVSEVYKSDLTESYDRGDYLEQIARTHLKYKYDYKTYKWRNEDLF